MNFNMQQLEDMNELDRLYLFEDIPEEDLKAHLESLPEDERVALLALIPEEIRCNMGYPSDQQNAFLEVSERFDKLWPKLEDFGGFSGRYGQKYKDWLEAYCPEEFWELVFKKELGAVCRAKNEEVANFIDDTVKALLVKNPAPDQNRPQRHHTAAVRFEREHNPLRRGRSGTKGPAGSVCPARSGRPQDLQSVQAPAAVRRMGQAAGRSIQPG